MLLILITTLLAVFFLILLAISPSHRTIYALCLFATIVVGLVLAAWNLSSKPTPTADLTPEQTAHFKAKGQEIISSTFARLSSELNQALTEGGVIGAVAICSDKALTITSQIAQAHGVSIRRAAVRNRNPQNAADSLERSAIMTFQKQIANDEHPEPIIRKTPNGHVTLLAPIRISSTTCLKCHGTPGDTIAPADYQTIRQLYPNDNATGFKLGDLRGIWRIDFSE